MEVDQGPQDGLIPPDVDGLKTTLGPWRPAWAPDTTLDQLDQARGAVREKALVHILSVRRLHLVQQEPVAEREGHAQQTKYCLQALDLQVYLRLINSRDARQLAKEDRDDLLAAEEVCRGVRLQVPVNLEVTSTSDVPSTHIKTLRCIK